MQETDGVRGGYSCGNKDLISCCLKIIFNETYKHKVNGEHD